jgi:hypothetical protein
MFIRDVDNPDQAPLGPGPEGQDHDLHSPT